MTASVIPFRSKPWPDRRRPEHARLFEAYESGQMNTTQFLAHVAADPALAAYVRRRLGMC